MKHKVLIAGKFKMMEWKEIKKLKPKRYYCHTFKYGVIYLTNTQAKKYAQKRALPQVWN